MGLISYALGQTSVVLRVKILDSSTLTGGKTGLAFNTSGLIISTVADNEATATAYTVAGSTIETITTLGTYAAPTATKCRFKEVDATNHKGVYEIQIADARFAVAGAKSLLVSISGATGACDCDVVIPLTGMNPYDGVHGGMTAIPNAAANAAGGLPTFGTGSGQLNPASGAMPVSGDLTATMKTSVTTAATAATPTALLTLTQLVSTSNTANTVGDALNAARAQGFGKWVLSGTSLALYAADGTTIVRTFTLDSATAPTQRS